MGYGEQGFVDGDSTLLYRIRFENKASASAAAQLVHIVDQLDENLDWSTLELLEIGFNHVVVRVPAGQNRFEALSGVASDPNPVRIRARLDPTTGTLSWTLQSIDPVTEDFPADPLAGFLPPNDGQGSGEGFVTFRVRLKPGLAEGTVIRNPARIVFDENDPIETNVTVNTVDRTPPTASIHPLPERSPANIRVSWEGTDGTGVGIAGYDVYVAVDNGPFELWQKGVAMTRATYPGQAGHTYSFYVMAVDHLGHRQRQPSAIAMTTVVETSIYLPRVSRDGGG